MEGCIKVCQYLLHCLHRSSLCAGKYTPIEIVTDECKRVYSATCLINPKSGKALRVRGEGRQVTFCKWKERLSGSSKGEWTRLLIHDLEAWLERGHGQMNFYLMQVMSGHGGFNVYLFRMKLVESLECTNCDRRGRDDDAWHTLFECLAFQVYWEDAMTTLQKKGELTMRRKIKIAQERQSRRQPPPPSQCQTLSSPVFAVSNPAMEDDPGWLASETCSK